MLAEEGVLEEFKGVAIKGFLAWQLANATKELHLSRGRLAERMDTGRGQVSRLLDPKGGNVALTTLQRPAGVVRCKVLLGFA